jgi:hypothetical protein
MTVFATHKNTHHRRNVAALLGVAALVVAGAISSQALRAPLTAALQDAMVGQQASKAQPTETVFPQSRTVEWEGVGFSVLAGGRGLAVRRADTGELFQAYGAEDVLASFSYGPVRVRGRWTGISCAYQQTLFEGQCTPTVDIYVLEILPIALE